MNIVLLIIVLGMITTVLLVSVSPATLARVIKRGSPFALIGIGILLTALRQPAFGGLLIAGGLALRRWLASRRAPAATSAPNRRSVVRTAALEMELDHETGAMDGLVLAGQFDGQELRDLNRAKLLALRTEVQDDGDSMALLDAYLDRRFAGWREDAEPNSDPGEAGPPRPGTMSEEEAYEVLGLAPGADLEAIRDAHRRLMMDVHPDRGGSTFLAAKINEAKDVLVRSHS